MTTRLIWLAPVVLAACLDTSAIQVNDDPELPQGSAGQAELLERECALYRVVAARLVDEGGTAPRGLTRGCPEGGEARALDINPMASPPPLMAGYPETLFQRLQARGVPADLAQTIAQSKAFWDLVARRDSLVAGL